MQDLGLRTWSADLIFAVPGQNLSMLDRDLDALIAANTPHISLYGLSIEPGTAFQTMQQRGQLRLPDEDVWAELFDRIRERLNRVGMEHYEISNFARKGHRSVHNSSTWRGGHYAGLGPSAHGFAPDGDRWMNPADVENWLENPPPLAERPSPASAAVDYLLSTLRHIEGSDLNELYAQTGLRPTESTVQTLIDGGMLKQEGPMLRLRPAGVALADGIVQKLCESLAGIP